VNVPRLGVSACVWRDGRVLVAQRAKPPFEGVWSLPGGHVEWGEALRDAARRELKEETGVEAELTTLLDVADVIYRNGADVTAHYAIVCFGGRWLSGEALAGDDALAVSWAMPEELSAMPMTAGTLDIILAARRTLAI
jgi:ADP-ribose pyrophosphatase YjhB (NUDIX family)